MIDHISPRFSIASAIGIVGLVLCLYSLHQFTEMFRNMGYLTILPILMLVTLCVNTAVACSLNLLQRDFIHIRRYGRKCLVDTILTFILMVLLSEMRFDGMLLVDWKILMTGMLLTFVSSMMILIKGFRGHRL